MIHIKRTQSSDPDFQKLIKDLDRELAIRDGDEHAFFAQYNTLVNIQHVVLILVGDIVVGCGAIKPYSDATMEVKRMFVAEEHRSAGLATMILKELEKWATELGFRHCILETGIRQPEAIRLYTKNAYQSIPNYGQYEGVASSVCFEKWLEK
ncbi:MAG TPA: GNAT family N-acetyltransferase [Catalimonadaceae bacterium]|nr:GNAT family N-acetyltransferase [Catalimonadaceae bacterium]